MTVALFVCVYCVVIVFMHVDGQDLYAELNTNIEMLEAVGLTTKTFLDALD